MKLSDIEEPVLLSSKENRVEEYISLGVTLLFIGVSFYFVLTDGTLLIMGLGLLIFFSLSLSRLYRGDIYVTRKAIYERKGHNTYRVLLFSELTYSFFDEPDSACLIFGTNVLTDLIITDDRQNYKELKKYLEQVSRENLDHYGYVIAKRKIISSSDRLGCLDCNEQFRLSDVKQWTTETTRWLFKKTEEHQPICPSCHKERSVVLCRSKALTTAGLKSMYALRGHV